VTAACQWPANVTQTDARPLCGRVIGPQVRLAIPTVQGELADPTRHEAGRLRAVLLSGAARCTAFAGPGYGARGSPAERNDDLARGGSASQACKPLSNEGTRRYASSAAGLRAGQNAPEFVSPGRRFVRGSALMPQERKWLPR
jgi:hypothetical protein